MHLKATVAGSKYPFVSQLSGPIDLLDAVLSAGARKPEARTAMAASAAPLRSATKEAATALLSASSMSIS